MAGYVYFIRMVGRPWVKIRYTAKPQKRLAYIKLIMPREFSFKIVAAMPGTYETEKKLHFDLMSDYDQGEWFRLSPKIKRLIKQVGIPKEFEGWVLDRYARGRR